jgi:hypothetical protein
MPCEQPGLVAEATKFTGLVVCELGAGLVMVTIGVAAKAVQLRIRIVRNGNVKRDTDRPKNVTDTEAPPLTV